MNPTSPSTFDAAGALASGASEDDVLGYLTKSRPYDIQGAMQAGASKRQIIDYLSSKPRNAVPGMEKLGGAAPGVPKPEPPDDLQGPPEQKKGFWSSMGEGFWNSLPHPVDALKEWYHRPQTLNIHSDQFGPTLPGSSDFSNLSAVAGPAVQAGKQLASGDPGGAIGTVAGGYGVPAALGASAPKLAYGGRLMKEAATDPFIRREVAKDLAGRGVKKLIKKVVPLPDMFGSDVTPAPGEPSLAGHWNAAKIRAKVGTYPDRPAPAWADIPDSEAIAPPPEAQPIPSALPSGRVPGTGQPIPTPPPVARPAPAWTDIQPSHPTVPSMEPIPSTLPSGRIPGTGQPAPSPPSPPMRRPPWESIQPISQRTPPMDPIYGPLPSGRVPGGSLRAQPETAPPASVPSSLSSAASAGEDLPLHPAHADNLAKLVDDTASVFQQYGIPSEKLLKMTDPQWDQIGKVVASVRGAQAGAAGVDLSNLATRRAIYKTLQAKEGKLTGSVLPPIATPQSPGVRILRPEETQTLRDRPNSAAIAQQLWPQQ